MKTSAGKFSLLFISCLLLRLIPVRVPNVEPILATLMPLSRIHGALASFSFAILSILSYDFATGTLGVHTLFTVFAYGALGIAASVYFSAKGRSASGGKDNIRDYVKFAIAGTLFFDAATGLTVGPLAFGQPFSAALIGQIPFTLLHLLGNIVFALTLSPAIDYFLERKRKRDKSEVAIIKPLNPKII